MMMSRTGDENKSLFPYTMIFSPNFRKKEIFHVTISVKLDDTVVTVNIS